jgi:hemerythrin-like domain-containing protein
MGWRKTLEREHRLMLEVADAAEKECARIEAGSAASPELLADMLGFFRYFCDGLHDPKEEGLLFARCHRRGMTDEDEPLEQMLCDHEWCRAELDWLQDELRRLQPDDRSGFIGVAQRLRGYIDMVRWHIEVEERVFFDLAQHYLTQEDRRELTEEFESVHYDEVEEGVAAYWEDLAHRLLQTGRA